MGSSSRNSGAEVPHRILEAAAAEFAAEGFAGARVDEIARRARINKAMLYYHFGDKAELYGAVIADRLQQAEATMRAAIEKISSPEDRLRAVVKVVAETAGSAAHLPQIILREAGSGGANLPKSALEGIGRIFAIIRHVLDEGRKQGRFRAVDPLLTHFLIAGGVMFLTASIPLRNRIAKLEDARSEHTDSPTDIAEHVSHLLLHGLLRGRSEAKK